MIPAMVSTWRRYSPMADPPDNVQPAHSNMMVALALLALLPSPAAPTPACAGPADCNFAGDCVGGRCVCDAIWHGPGCMHLNLGPIPAATDTDSFAPGVYPAGALEGVQRTWTWGAGGARDEGGLYHWFVTQVRVSAQRYQCDFRE